MEKFKEISRIIEDYIALLDVLITFEQNKLDAVQEKNDAALDLYLKDEQAYLLKLRGLDQKRESVQKKLGIAGLTYKEIIALSEGDEKVELDSLYNILSSKTSQFKQLVDSIKTYIEIRLHTIDSIRTQFGASLSAETSTGIYDRLSSEAATGTPSSHGKFQSTKV